MLVQHWARDESVFPTEDDRHDVATTMLFQAYTGGRPAEFVHASKGKASEDPLGEKEETNKNKHFQKVAHSDYNDDSDFDDASDSGDELFDSEDDGGDDDVSFDSDDDGGDDDNEDMEEQRRSDSGYASDESDVTMTEDTDKCYTTKLDESGKPLRQTSNAAERGDFEEAKRKYKALCYEDIYLWIVQNPKAGERDVLAMEVNLQNHKGVDNKPKPYATLTRYLDTLANLILTAQPSSSERILSPSSIRSPIS
jgi:hypothetical protein